MLEEMDEDMDEFLIPAEPEKSGTAQPEWVPQSGPSRWPEDDAFD